MARRPPAAALPCLLALLATGARAADCHPDGLALFPAPGAVVATNVQFLLEGVGAEQERVTRLLAEGALALVAKDRPPVEVRAEKGWVSQRGRVAIRLRPMRSLEPKTEYALALPPFMAGARLLDDRLGDGSLRWLTAAAPDLKAPRYRAKPAASEGFYEGGGAVRRLKLRAVVEERGPAWLLVSLARARGGSAQQQYPVPLEGDTLVIGHDACSGSFGFEDGRAYRLTFELFDAAGNRAREKARLEVSAPRPLGR